MTASRSRGRARPPSPDPRPRRCGAHPFFLSVRARARRGILHPGRLLARAAWLSALGALALPATAQGTNNAPVFANSTETRTVPENSAAGTNVGSPIPEATDADSGDTLTYSMAGADAGSFAFDPSTRQITTIANVAYNHEATKNSYSVAVNVDDGNDGTDTTAVTIDLTDVPEQPARPGRPRLSTVRDSATTLSAIWKEPSLNGGPAITGYDLQYREGTGGEWTDFEHTGTAVRTTVTGLTGDTEYQMRVRAKNGEMDSDWSDPSDGARTAAADASLEVLRVVTASAVLAGYRPNATRYAMSVPNSDDEATVTATATANDDGASVEILNSSDMGIADADAMEAGFQVALAVGSTVIRAKVTAVDGTTTRTYAVTVTRATAGNDAPAFPSSTAMREVPENSTAGTVVGLPIPEATDEDSGDTLTYAMAGADAGSFVFDASTRQITTKAGVTYNHEAAKNTYEVTVNANDGTDSGAIPVTINVADVDEQPAKPGKPGLATVSGSSTSLTATWTKPELNGGPDIVGYDLAHREGTSGEWIRFPHSGTEVTATITGLKANTEYQVQVRAENDEADSDWSDASDAVRTNVADGPESFAAWSGNAQVRLTWNAPEADADITRHEYRFRTAGDYPDMWTEIGDSAPGGAHEDGFVVTGLDNDVAYTFELRSANADDASTAAEAGPVTPRHGVCSRTRQVRDAIVAAISAVSHCAQVTTTQLAGVTRLELQSTDLGSLQPDDFSGLTALTWLFLENNELRSLPAGVFSGLAGLSSLNLRGNDLVSLPAGLFSGLTTLETLYLHANRLDSLADDVFSGLTALSILELRDNELDSLPAGLFSGLTALRTLHLSGNKLDSLVDDVFSGLTTLQSLDLSGNKLDSLVDDVFSGLTALLELRLSGNPLGSLSRDVISGLTTLELLYLSDTRLDSLADDMFSGLTALQRLSVSRNSLSSLPDDVFSGLTALTRLWVYDNDLGSLADGVFSGLAALTRLYVYDNDLGSLSADVFADQTALEQLWLNDNDLAALPDGVFSGLTTLTTLRLGGNPNPGDVLPLTVTVAKVGTDQARAKVLAGAPFAVDFTSAVVNGALAGGATALGVAAGSVDGTAVTVERTSGTTAAVTVDVDLTAQPTLPAKNDDEYHAGYEFAKTAGSEPREILPSVGATPNSAPVFDPATATRTVPENSPAGTNVGLPIPAATDADSGDTLTYSLEGTDKDAFDFDASARQIKTKTGVTYDHEATQNSYSVTVQASDGTDSATVAVTIDVTDVNEQPATPDQPTLAAVSASSTSLDASWTAPDRNGGPEIAGYGLEYRAGATGMWTDFAHTGAGATATITGLEADTEYQARVLAKNGETDSDWSDASDAVRTLAADATLSGLAVNDGTSDLALTPAFAAGTTAYAASVEYAVDEVTVTATKNDAGAKVDWLDGDDNALDDADDVETGRQVTLAEGANTIKARVTAEDETATRTYVLTVTRAAPADVLVSIFPEDSGTDFLTFVQSGNSQRHYFAETFTAGAGFALTAVDIPFRHVPDNSRVTVSLHARDGSKPGKYLADLDLSGALAAGTNTFAAPAGTALASGTYFVRVRWRSGDTNNLRMTDGPDDETSAESGWSVQDSSRFSASGSSWSNWNEPFAMRVRGTVDGVPRVATRGIRIESDPDAHDSYGVGEDIEVAADFTEDVTADTTGGAPRVALTVGSNTRYAAYSASGSSADELAFVYTVTADDHDQDGVSVDADALELNGGAIHKDSDSSTNAVLDHAALDADSDHRVNRDPIIVAGGVSVISAPTAATDTYGVGETIEIEVEFSAAVDATTDTDFVLSVAGARRAPLLAARARTSSCSATPWCRATTTTAASGSATRTGR